MQNFNSKETPARVGIIGGGGYTAGELIRLLLHHPDVSLDFVQSESQAGKPVWVTHEDLVGDTEMTFSEAPREVDVLFICRGHGRSRDWLAENPVGDETLVIDLSSDFRMSTDWTYGLPELNRTAITAARRIANPGCFATAIQLALLPLANQRAVAKVWHVNAITGSTGAGRSPGSTTHFSWRNSNVSVYKAFNHQHLLEIGRSLDQISEGHGPKVNFLPVRGNFTRGIFASCYADTELTEAELKRYYEDFYAETPFVHLNPGEPHLKQVVNTNKALLSVQEIDGKVLVVSMIDNLLKGASGQAIQNMNLALGLPETSGLALKAGLY